MIGRTGLGGSQSWQLVLADLALILFLVTLTALVTSSSEDDELLSRAAYIAPAQALFRPTEQGPTLAQWLAEQPADPRTTLTIMAQHKDEDQALMWENAQSMAASIADSPVSVRVIITSGDQNDLYASLAYDEASITQ